MRINSFQPIEICSNFKSNCKCYNFKENNSANTVNFRGNLDSDIFSSSYDINEYDTINNLNTSTGIYGQDLNDPLDERNKQDPSSPYYDYTYNNPTNLYDNDLVDKSDFLIEKDDNLIDNSDSNYLEHSDNSKNPFESNLNSNTF